MFKSLAIAASGLTAQRTRLDVAASNIANAETTRGPNGGAYKRLVVQMAPAGTGPVPPEGAFAPGMSPIDIAPIAGAPAFNVATASPAEQANGVVVTGIAEDNRPGALVYDPGHPDADQNGYVHTSNVRVTEELVDVMDARRAYEANATVFQSAKALLRRCMEI